MNANEKLAIIMPVYNESGCIELVVNKYINILNKLKINYTFFLYNDGSTDNTEQILNSIAIKKTNIVVVNKKNSGHGPTILSGYKNIARNCHKFIWVFQTDSDNELPSEDFVILWNNRKEFDFLVGIRSERSQNLIRKIISCFSRLTIKLLFGKTNYDVNCPYRLMRVSSFSNLFTALPENTFAPNIIISGYAGLKSKKTYEIKVKYSPRQTGKISLSNFKFFKYAILALWQTILFRINFSKSN